MPSGSEYKADGGEDNSMNALWIHLIGLFTSDRSIAIATVVYAAVTYVMFRAIRSQAVAAHRQADIMTQQIQAMDKGLDLQADALRQMDGIAKGQAADMRDSIAEASRSAKAMEQVAKDIGVSAKAATESVAALNKQMRAYLTVIIGLAVYQDREKGLKFEGKPTMMNTGLTPAKKVVYHAKADILPMILPEDFDFPLPKKATVTGGSVIGAHQSNIMSAIVDDFVPDQDVEAIKSGSGKSVLYCRGMVTYEDVFGESHETKFCQTLTWLRDEKQTIFGCYCPRHNDAT
jgi:hypothetical protein